MDGNTLGHRGNTGCGNSTAFASKHYWTLLPPPNCAIMPVMREVPLKEMRLTIGFGEIDAANVRAVAPILTPHIPETVDQFYRRLLESPGARAVFTGGEQQIADLRTSLTRWLQELLEGRFDATYYEKRKRIGIVHVRVGLPQHYMIAGTELIRQELERHLRTADVRNIESKVDSLHKALVLDLAVMLDSYKSSYAENIREYERSAVEEKLTRAEHLAEIGQLAASLAHEIKNPLAGISGAIQIIRDAMPGNDPHQPIVTEILGQIRRLDATVKDLLQYARPTPPMAAKVALDAMVRRVLTVLRKEPSLHQVDIQYATPPDNPVIYADDRQIEQLLINLIINAAHASKAGGTIHLVVRRDSDGVRLNVRDEGDGMTRATRRRAFEPFFTTKAKGTGLGLSICRRIVEVHGGQIRIDSELGRGTTVAVRFPLNHRSNQEERR